MDVNEIESLTPPIVLHENIEHNINRIRIWPFPFLMNTTIKKAENKIMQPQFSSKF